MMEMSCTLRCDGCERTRAATLKMHGVSENPPGWINVAFQATQLPGGWRLEQDRLLCPRCPTAEPPEPHR